MLYLRPFFLCSYCGTQAPYEQHIVPSHAKFPSAVFVALQNNTLDRSKAPMCKANTLLWQPKDTDTSSAFVTTAGLIVTTPPVRCSALYIISLRLPCLSPTPLPPSAKHVEGSAKHHFKKEEAETRQFARGCKHGGWMLFSADQERLCNSGQVKIDKMLK